MSLTNLSPVIVQRGRSVVSFHPLSRCASVTSIRSKILEKSADTQPEDSSDGSCKCDECWKRTESEKINHSGMESRYLSDLRWRMSHSVNIYLYRNGFEGEKPCLVHIPPNALKNMKTLMNVIQERLKMKILVGYAKKLYRMDGGILRHPCELTMYNNYVVATNFDKCFKSVSYGRQKSPLMILHSESKHARVLRNSNRNDMDQINTSRIKGQGDEKLPYMYKEFDDEIGGSGDCVDTNPVYESDLEKSEYKYPTIRKAERTISKSARPNYNEKPKPPAPAQLLLPPLTPKKNFQQKSKPPPAINSYRPVENKNTEFTFGQKNIVQQKQSPPIRPVFPPQNIRTTNNNVLKLPALSARQQLQQQQQQKLTGRAEKKLINNRGFNSSKSTVKSVSKATQTESLTGVQRILERCAGLAAGLGQPAKLFPTQQQFDPFKFNYFNQPGAAGVGLSPFDQFFLSQMQINAQQAAWQSNGISFSNISGSNVSGPTSWQPSSQDFSTINSANLRNSNPSFMNPTGGCFLPPQNFNQLNGNSKNCLNNIFSAPTKSVGNFGLTNGITKNSSSWSNNTTTTTASDKNNSSSGFSLSQDISNNDMNEKARRGPRKKRRRL